MGPMMRGWGMGRGPGGMAPRPVPGAMARERVGAAIDALKSRLDAIKGDKAATAQQIVERTRAALKEQLDRLDKMAEALKEAPKPPPKEPPKVEERRDRDGDRRDEGHGRPFGRRGGPGFGRGPMRGGR
jgi:hypothetical protein